MFGRIPHLSSSIDTLYNHFPVQWPRQWPMHWKGRSVIILTGVAVLSLYVILKTIFFSTVKSSLPPPLAEVNTQTDAEPPHPQVAELMSKLEALQRKYTSLEEQAQQLIEKLHTWKHKLLQPVKTVRIFL